MNAIISVSLVLIILVVATFSTLYIFDVMAFEDAISLGLKLSGAIAVFGISALAIYLISGNKRPSEKPEE